MSGDTSWALPFSDRAELELHSEMSSLSLQPVEPGRAARVELSPGSLDRIELQIDKHGDIVRVAIEPPQAFTWFGAWECRATLYVPTNVRAHVQTSAGTVTVRRLQDCELGIKAGAGKIDLDNVYGLMHVSADAGSVRGHDVGGYFDVETHAGSIRLDITDLQPGEHRIRASMGSVRLELARGLDVSVDTRTSLGSIRNDYPASSAAATRLVVTTEMGSVRISEGGRVRAAPSSATTASVVPGAAVQRADPELERILKMVEAGELSARDADEVLRALGRV